MQEDLSSHRVRKGSLFKRITYPSKGHKGSLRVESGWSEIALWWLQSRCLLLLWIRCPMLGAAVALLPDPAR